MVDSLLYMLHISLKVSYKNFVLGKEKNFSQGIFSRLKGYTTELLFLTDQELILLTRKYLVA